MATVEHAARKARSQAPVPAPELIRADIAAQLAGTTLGWRVHWYACLPWRLRRAVMP